MICIAFEVNDICKSVRISLFGHAILRLEVLWVKLKISFIRFVAYQTQNVSYVIVYQLEVNLLICLLEPWDTIASIKLEILEAILHTPDAFHDLEKD